VKGDLELLAGDVQKALRTYRLAQRAGPALAQPLTAIARAELSRGRVEPARKALQRALEVQPSDEEASRLLSGLR
jgi:Flp pilus assembly protein TadD